jgi:hypothetical protein
MGRHRRRPAQAQAFERALVDDNWSRLEPYFSADASYETIGEGGERFDGRPAVVAALRRAVTNFDRRCDSRSLITTAGPFLESSEVRRNWSSRFTLSGAPDLILEGSERALYRGDLIELLQETLTPESRAQLNYWVAAHGSRLAPKRNLSRG